MAKSIELYQVDAFTSEVFQGNPAAVCLLHEPLTDEVMQKIAAENNVSETAFVLLQGSKYPIRYFSPAAEVDLCGHATLSSAFVLSEFVEEDKQVFTFQTRTKGEVSVEVKNNLFVMNLPADTLMKITEEKETIETAFQLKPSAVYKGQTDYLLVYNDAEDILNLQPDLSRIRDLNARGVIVTAPGADVDFVSRFFAPAIGVDEDPVTGSAHTTLVPYWTEKLGKKEFTSAQLSKRGGKLYCKNLGNRTEVAGEAVLYMKGEIKAF